MFKRGKITLEGREIDVYSGQTDRWLERLFFCHMSMDCVIGMLSAIKIAISNGFRKGVTAYGSTYGRTDPIIEMQCRI